MNGLRVQLSVAAVVVGSISGTAGAGSIEPFTEEAVARGLTYVMQNGPQSTGYLGFGCGFADLDGDGDPDIVIIGAADGKVGIFENDGSGQFIDRSDGTGLPPLTQGVGFAAADYDGDGDLDLYLTQVGIKNILGRNEGGFQFSSVAVTAGVDDIGSSQAPNFGDFDNDGWLDLYVCNYPGVAEGTEDIHNKLYRNLGNGEFEDVSAAQTVDYPGLSFQAVWFDYDRDGDVDLYLSNDKGHQIPSFPNQLWRNDGGTLVNVSQEAGADVGLNSMGVACGDFDGNHWPDVYCTNVPGAGGMNNPLLLNQGNGTFIDQAPLAGVDNPWTSWGSIFFDFDNNGHQDLYVNNMFDANAFYANYGSFPCPDIAAPANVMAGSGHSFGSAIADVDADGDWDLLVNNLSGNVQLFINQEGDNRNWIRYRMVGQPPNTFAVGGNTDTRIGGSWTFREVLAGGNGYLGQNEMIMHVGLNDATVADEVVIKWPGGSTTRTLTNLPANHLWTLYPPQRLGDADDNGVVDLEDFAVFADCFNAAAFEPGCEIMDFDGNSQVTLDDLSAFLDAFDGTPADCNDNGIPDLQDILLDANLDQNGDGLLDSCECPVDLNGDAQVDAVDLGLLLGAWGPTPGHPADLNLDGLVNGADLAALLGGWGPCY